MAACVGAAAKKHFEYVQGSLTKGNPLDVLAAFLECRLIPSITGVKNFLEIYNY